MEENSLVNMSLVKLSSLIQKREISTIAVVNTFLERIERLQPELRAYITICREEALISAKKISDSLTRGEARKPLFMKMIST
jgi:Asp-tRNA(Asn)/Glu-tRNA(Gln) amidotransferase A subunit family amidase